jgi:hypothetical protein
VRINVYAEELTTETELVTKTVTDDKFGTRTFYGIRMYLKSPDELHHDPVDDDRSAVTVWVPWTRDRGHNFSVVTALLMNMLGHVGQAVVGEAVAHFFDRIYEVDTAGVVRV